MWAIEKFRAYLEADHFTVVTDHHSLKWLKSLKDPTSRLANWSLKLSKYKYDIQYRKGSLNVVPDFLSRLDQDEEPISALLETADEWYLKRKADVQRHPHAFPNWKMEDNLLFHHVVNTIIDFTVPDLDVWKLVLPRELRAKALSEAHDEPQAGHQGTERTYQRVALRYYWPGYYRDVVKYVKSCKICSITKVDQRKPIGEMGHRVAEEPWLMIGADVMGPYVRSERFQYILIIQDLFTRMIEIFPLAKATGKTIAECLHQNVINRWGAPSFLLTDNGTEFNNKTVDALCKAYNIRMTRTPKYHPQSNPVERVNRVIRSIIRAIIDKTRQHWEQYLPEFRFAFNTAQHSSLKTTPAFLNMGRNPLPTGTVFEELKREPKPPPCTGNVAEWHERMRKIEAVRDLVKLHIDKSHTKQAHNYNLRRRQHTFDVGDRVLQKDRTLSSAQKGITASLNPPYNPEIFVISRKISDNVFELTDCTGKFQPLSFHSKDLKPVSLDNPAD